MKSTTVLSAGILTLGLTGFASADVIIGNFETSALDAWGTDGGPGSPTLAQDTIGATLGTNSLKATVPQGNFWGPSTGNLSGDLLIALRDSPQLAFDLTLIGTELNGGNAFSGFAQSNEISVQLSYGTHNLFIQKNWAAAGVSDSKGHDAQWSGDDGTRTLVWDLTKLTFDDPAGGGTKSVSQLITDHQAEITDAKINFVTQIGGGDAAGSMYYDNVRLVPEPATMAALGLGVLAVLRRRRS